jgi:AhpD family alkylhydroperoxidase
MVMKDLIAYNDYRHKMNDRINTSGHLGMKRFWALDSRAYTPGTLDEKTLEFMGLTTSMVLRCDDCVTYHIIRLIQLGTSNIELYEALNVSLVVGGSIIIPHLRRAFETIDSCRKMQETDPELKSLL